MLDTIERVNTHILGSSENAFAAIESALDYWWWFDIPPTAEEQGFNPEEVISKVVASKLPEHLRDDRTVEAITHASMLLSTPNWGGDDRHSEALSEVIFELGANTGEEVNVDSDVFATRDIKAVDATSLLGLAQLIHNIE